MTNIIDEAKNSEQRQIKNVSDLNIISTDLEVFTESNIEYPYKYIVINSERYKLPISVLISLKAILEENPKLKKFRVKKQGEGMNTKYTVIPLE